MFPLTHTETSYESSSFSSGEREGNSWNMIFYNSKTGSSHLLSDSLKMLIWNYTVENDNYSSSGNDEISYSSREANPVDKTIFYRITLKDHNNDKRLDKDDPTYLFTSNKEGNDLRQLSPANSDLISFEYIKVSGKVLMYVKKDGNKDNVFDEKDEQAWYEIRSSDHNDVAREIFTDNFKNKLKLLFHKHWAKQP